MTDELLTVFRFIAGGYFVWSGSSKIGKVGDFWSQIMGYKITGPKTSRLLASGLPPLELVGGLFFASGLAHASMGILLLSLLAVFSTAISIAIARGTDNECGCGPTRSKVRPSLLLRNALLASLIVAGIFSPSNMTTGSPIIVGCGIVVVALVTAGSYRSLGK